MRDLFDRRTGSTEVTDLFDPHVLSKEVKDLLENHDEAIADDLDVVGCARTFAWLHGWDGWGGEKSFYGAFRTLPAFAYDPVAQTWREWNMRGWRPKRSVLVEMHNAIAAVCAQTAAKAGELVSGEAQRSEKAGREYRKLREKHLAMTTDKAIRLAQVLLTVEQWDAQDNMIGLPDGEALGIADDLVDVIDQQLGDHILRQMAATPSGRSSLWEGFLDDLTGGDTSMKDALQVWMASALLPGNVHRRAHILYGDGHTGKSTFAKAIQAAFGDYAGSARASVFTDERSGHPAELLPFMAHRLVVLPELPRGVLRSDLLKTITGGDSVSVRGMRENPRTAQPDATLIFTANELPALRHVYKAIRTRLLIWPMDNHLERPDVQLGQKLASPEHLEAITAWLHEGLRRYAALMASGEPMPIAQAVATATELYFNEADQIGAWAEECLAEGAETQASDLYKGFVLWCEANKRKPQTERSVGTWLSRHYSRRHSKRGSFYPVYMKQ